MYGDKRVNILFWPTAWLCGRWEAHLLWILYGVVLSPQVVDREQRSRLPMRMGVGDSTPLEQVCSVSSECQVNRTVLKNTKILPVTPGWETGIYLWDFPVSLPHAASLQLWQDRQQLLVLPGPLVPLNCPVALRFLAGNSLLPTWRTRSE